jgi:hypothetical protein
VPQREDGLGSSARCVLCTDSFWTRPTKRATPHCAARRSRARGARRPSLGERVLDTPPGPAQPRHTPSAAARGRRGRGAPVGEVPGLHRVDKVAPPTHDKRPASARARERERGAAGAAPGRSGRRLQSRCAATTFAPWDWLSPPPPCPSSASASTGMVATHATTGAGSPAPSCSSAAPLRPASEASQSRRSSGGHAGGRCSGGSTRRNAATRRPMSARRSAGMRAAPAEASAPASLRAPRRSYDSRGGAVRSSAPHSYRKSYQIFRGMPGPLALRLLRGPWGAGAPRRGRGAQAGADAGGERTWARARARARAAALARWWQGVQRRTMSWEARDLRRSGRCVR